MVNLTYVGSRGRVLRPRRGRRRVSSNSSGASTIWYAGWVDPVITLTPGLTGNTQVAGRAELDDFEEVSLVSGFIQISAGVYNAAAAEGAGGFLIMGLRVQPATIVDVAEMPDPFNESSGDWLWYRTFPLLDRAAGQWDQSNSVSVNDQIRSARRVPRDSEIALSYTWLDADVAAADAEVQVLASWRLLLRVP